MCTEPNEDQLNYVIDRQPIRATHDNSNKHNSESLRNQNKSTGARGHRNRTGLVGNRQKQGYCLGVKSDNHE